MTYENVAIQFTDGVTVGELMHAQAVVKGKTITVITKEGTFPKKLSEVAYFSSQGKEVNIGAFISSENQKSRLKR